MTTEELLKYVEERLPSLEKHLFDYQNPYLGLAICLIKMQEKEIRSLTESRKG